RRFMFARTSVTFGPDDWISLCGMMSLFTKRKAVPALSVIVRFAVGLPLPSCHMWQPFIWWLIVIVDAPPAEAEGTAIAAAAAASTRKLLIDMVPPSGYSAQCAAGAAAVHPRADRSSVRVSADVSVRRREHLSFMRQSTYAVWWQEDDGSRHAG